MKIRICIRSFRVLAYAKFSSIYIYEVHFHDAGRTLSFMFEKQVLDVGNVVSFDKTVVSPVSWLIWKQDGRKMYAIGRLGAR